MTTRRDLPKVSLDFDGVLHSYTRGWTGYHPADPPEEGALEFVERLTVAGYDLYVVSARADHPHGRNGIKQWLNRHGFPNLPVGNKKIGAVAYVDDRAVHYDPGSTDWTRVLSDIKNLEMRKQ